MGRRKVTVAWETALGEVTTDFCCVTWLPTLLLLTPTAAQTLGTYDTGMIKAPLGSDLAAAAPA